MNYIDIPNIPDKEVTHVLVDGRISDAAEKSLIAYGISVISTKRHDSLYDAIAYHPDVMFHHTGANTAIYAPGTDTSVIEMISGLGFVLSKGSALLTSGYPGDISYNAARIGNSVIHNFKYTDGNLLDIYKNKGLGLINVKQGYSKCSVSVIDEKSIITGDVGIAANAEKAGLEVLLIDHDENILLPGLNRGFIGGATGLIGPKLWAVNGKLESLKCCKQITEFLDKRGIVPVSLTQDIVIDIGSIIPLTTR